MSRTFVDQNLLSWEVYASGGKFGLPERPKIIFLCLSNPAMRARYTVFPGDDAAAAAAMAEMPEPELLNMLAESRPLD